MLYPSIKELLEKVDSRYTLVVLSAKRARQLTEDDMQTGDGYSKKPVSIAVEEINEGKVTYIRTHNGIK